MAEPEYDLELLERLAATTEGNALAHLELAEHSETPEHVWLMHRMLAGSGLVIAASYWSLIDSRRAIADYRRAARLYRAMRHSYWMVAAMAAADGKMLRAAAREQQDHSEASPLEVAFGLVTEGMSGADFTGERLTGAWQTLGNVPVGRLGIPLNHYGNCRTAMLHAQAGDREIFTRHARTYLERAAEVIRMARHDQYHWQRLQSSILPAEPEAVAVTSALSLTARRSLGMSLMEIGVEDRQSRTLIEVAESLSRAAATEDEPPPRLERA